MYSKKLPKINFIGNKEKIASWICDKFPKESKTVFDVFSGGGSVSFEAKKKGFKVISNDVLKINYILAKALIETEQKEQRAALLGPATSIVLPVRHS